LPAEICRNLRFWIGTREEFIDLLGKVRLPPLDITNAEKSIKRDKEAHAFRYDRLGDLAIAPIEFVFEEF
jgi:hypothetical protein